MEHSFEEKKYKTKSNNIKTIVIVFSFFLFFSDVIWRCVHSLQARKLSWMKGSIHRLSSLNRQLSTFHSCHMTINIANFFYALIAVSIQITAYMTDDYLSVEFVKWNQVHSNDHSSSLFHWGLPFHEMSFDDGTCCAFVENLSVEMKRKLWMFQQIPSTFLGHFHAVDYGNRKRCVIIVNCHRNET